MSAPEPDSIAWQQLQRRAGHHHHGLADLPYHRHPLTASPSFPRPSSAASAASWVALKRRYARRSSHSVRDAPTTSSSDTSTPTSSATGAADDPLNPRCAWSPTHAVTPYSVARSEQKTPRCSQSSFPQLSTPLPPAPDPHKDQLQARRTKVLANRTIVAGQNPQVSATVATHSPPRRA